MLNYNHLSGLQCHSCIMFHVTSSFVHANALSLHHTIYSDCNLASKLLFTCCHFQHVFLAAENDQQVTTIWMLNVFFLAALWWCHGTKSLLVKPAAWMIKWAVSVQTRDSWKNARTYVYQCELYRALLKNCGSNDKTL